jgi:hypothetical protein
LYAIPLFPFYETLPWLGTPPNLIGFAEAVALRLETFLAVTVFCFFATGFDFMAIFFSVCIYENEV